MMIPKIKETARTTRSVASLSSSSSSRSSCFQHETTPATATPLPRYKVVNAQSILASILLLFCLDLYVNIADFDRGRRESRKSINGGVGYDVPSQLIDGAIVTEKKEQASRISSDGAPPPSITLSKEKVGNFRVIDEASQQLSVPPAHEHARNSKSSNNDANNDNINNKKPTLVLHMGPTKTGSTFTQCVLTNMQETLALDNYTYLGMGINPCLPRVQDEESSDFHERRQQLMQHCYNSMFIYNTGHVAKLAPEALTIFRRAAASFIVEPRQRQNAILVNECFEFYTPHQIKVLVAELRPYWNVKIIMNYRRIYEFLPSSYNQNLKPKSHVKEFELWPGERARLGSPRVVDYLQNTAGNTGAGGGTSSTTSTSTTSRKMMVEGREILPFDIDNRNGFTNQFLRMENDGVHPIEEVKRLYRHYWPDITIVKSHELNRSSAVSGDAGLQKLFCDILDDMPHSCAAAKLDATIAVAKPYSNSFEALDYELLAIAAFRQRLFGFQQKDGLMMKRRRAVHKIRHFQEHDLNLTIADFPQDCLPRHKLDRIINASLLVERTLFSKEKCCSTQVETNHRRAFDEYNRKKQRYCTIDVNATLQKTEWVDFLASF